MLSRFKSRLLVLTAALGLTLAAHAQSFPSKPIRLICPFPPGGAVDIASRAIAAELSKNLGQTVTVDAAYVDARLGELSRDEDLSRYIL